MSSITLINQIKELNEKIRDLPFSNEFLELNTDLINTIEEENKQEILFEQTKKEVNEKFIEIAKKYKITFNNLFGEGCVEIKADDISNMSFSVKQDTYTHDSKEHNTHTLNLHLQYSKSERKGNSSVYINRSHHGSLDFKEDLEEELTHFFAKFARDVYEPKKYFSSLKYQETYNDNVQPIVNMLDQLLKENESNFILKFKEALGEGYNFNIENHLTKKLFASIGHYNFLRVEFDLYDSCLDIIIEDTGSDEKSVLQHIDLNHPTEEFELENTLKLFVEKTLESYNNKN